MMTLEECAKKNNISLEILEELLEKDERRKKYIETHTEANQLDTLAQRTVSELLAANKDYLAELNSCAQKEKSVRKTDKIEEGTAPEDSLSTQSVEKEELSRKQNTTVAESKKTKKPRTKKKPEPINLDIPFPEEIDMGRLRKFYLDNFSVKPEKMCLMSDEEIRQSVSEKYIFIASEDEKYIVVKRGANVFVI